MNNSFIKFLFYHHIIIAFCALALSVQTKLFYSIFDYPLTLITFVFLATLLSYNVHFTLAARKNNNSAQLKWFREKKELNLLFNFLTLILMFWFWWKIRSVTYLIIISIIINFTYTGPLLLKKPVKLPTLLTFKKSYFIGFVWAFVTVVLPLAFFKVEPQLNEIFLFMNRMMLVALATMIFDYRDKLQDFESGVHTPANLMSEKQFTLFFWLNVLIYFVTVFVIAARFQNNIHLLQIIPGFLLVYLLDKSKKQTGEYFYLGIVDGVLLLSSLLSLFILI